MRKRKRRTREAELLKRIRAKKKRRLKLRNTDAAVLKRTLKELTPKPAATCPKCGGRVHIASAIGKLAACLNKNCSWVGDYQSVKRMRSFVIPKDAEIKLLDVDYAALELRVAAAMHIPVEYLRAGSIK